MHPSDYSIGKLILFYMLQATSAILSVVPAFSIVAFISCIVLCVLIIFALVKRRLPSRKYR